MKLFFEYLRARRGTIILFACFVSVFAVTFALCRLTLTAVLYPACLCLLIAAGAGIYGFFKFKKKHTLLKNIMKLKSVMTEALPACSNLEENDYQELVRILCEEIRDVKTSSDRSYRDMIEYYTVWAHQIKTPIASMKLTLQNEDNSLARQLNSDLFRIEQYVEMVLAFLRMDSEYSDYVFAPCNADDIMRRSVKKFAHEFIRRKIGMEYEELNITLITDEKWLSFVFEQLLSNALKYTRRGSVRIYAEDCTICIEDTGIGIAPEDLPRIFEKGYTGKNGRIDKTASGLGLYLCKTVCDRLGIVISAESEIENGTIIRMTPAKNLQKC